jgi:hypothetical protein
VPPIVKLELVVTAQVEAAALHLIDLSPLLFVVVEIDGLPKDVDQCANVPKIPHSPPQQKIGVILKFL